VRRRTFSGEHIRCHIPTPQDEHHHKMEQPGLFLCLLCGSILTGGETMSEPRHTNRLAKETSPYLLQHQHNPVDWYPWGEEAFARAKAEEKPLLLSVGYSACFPSASRPSTPHQPFLHVPRHAVLPPLADGFSADLQTVLQTLTG
jgi:hypothetical protein